MNEPNKNSADRWFGTIMGHTLMRGAGVVALILIIGPVVTEVWPWWITMIGLAICALVAWWGNKLRTHTVTIDAETGKVPKNNL